MIEPYWKSADGRHVIYNADCLQVLPELEAGSVVTDPPWVATKKGITHRKGGRAKTISPSLGIGYGSIGEFSSEAIDLAFQKTRHDMLVICGFKELGEVINVLSPIRGVFVWHKPNGGISVAYPCPLDTAYIVWGAHTSKMYGFQYWKSCVMSHSVPTAGCISNGERILIEKNGKAAHPCQGPLSLYIQLIQPNFGTILDPFMGSGTTGVACVRTNRRFIGIEIEKRYCDIAVKRIERELSQPMLPFAAPEENAEQSLLFDE